ncbi:DUF4143 domain-containing protein [Nocardioides panacisoli]|uniref:DUF4143 domain-containing protein n=1 Tax=Nocardioides panacisoli TaxID=627624 RepID=UPI001C63298B|nr:DUF4143 domain-containing protein [Nocardioides panacisoli]QYJ03964.1 DUF4143 domain-containing protein [Nocardioides panacisoli]
MVADFVARLGSRAFAPGEVHSAWDLTAYAAPLTGGDRAAADLDRHLGEAQLGRLDPDRLRRVLRAIAQRPAAELNQAQVAATAGIPATTVPPYVEAAVDLGLVLLLPGSRATVTKRAIGRPRAVLADPALASHLAGVDPTCLTEVDARSRLAPYLRGMAYAELLRQQPHSAVEHRLGHLRERNGLQVDLVIELPDDTVLGLEVRTAQSLRPHQFRGLTALAARAGWRMRGGIVLNTAPVGHRYRPDLWGLPLATLWESDTAGASYR